MDCLPERSSARYGVWAMIYTLSLSPAITNVQSVANVVRLLAEAEGVSVEVTIAEIVSWGGQVITNRSYVIEPSTTPSDAPDGQEVYRVQDLLLRALDAARAIIPEFHHQERVSYAQMILANDADAARNRFILAIEESRDALQVITTHLDDHLGVEPDQCSWANVGDARRVRDAIRAVVTILEGGE